MRDVGVGAPLVSAPAFVSALYSSEADPARQFDAADRAIRHLLSWTRCLSRQAPAPTVWSSVSTEARQSELTDPVCPEPATKPAFMAGSCAWRCAVTRTVIDRLAGQMTDEEPPTHHEVLLDASAAYATGGFRACFIYAAIAMEAAAENVLRAAYAATMANGFGNPTFRVRSVRANKATVTNKDYVYEELCRCRPWQWSALHLRPLYLMGRSLLLDRKRLYDDVKAVHDWRNDIAHTGDWSAGRPRTDRLRDSYALRALKVAVDVFTWLGEEPPHVMPDAGPLLYDAVPCSGAVSQQGRASGRERMGW